MKIYVLYFNLNPLAIVQSLQKSPGVRRTVIYDRLKKFVEIHECTRINNRLKVSPSFLRRYVDSKLQN